MRISDWMRLAAIASAVSWAAAGRSIAAAPSPQGGQPALDLIATVPFDKTFKELGATPPPPGPFSSWTSDQQRSVPADLGKLCASFWTFINGADGPPEARLLPAAVPGAEEIQLVMDVCLVGHLPADWPERGAKLQSAKAILEQANQSGARLHLPPSVSP